MSKTLTGSAGTGKKILQNRSQFHFNYQGVEKATGKDFYTFNWSFGNQFGTAVIELVDSEYIGQSSTLNCCEFLRPLGAYNDNTLYEVFGIMLHSQNIHCK